MARTRLFGCIVAGSSSFLVSGRLLHQAEKMTNIFDDIFHWPAELKLGIELGPRDLEAHTHLSNWCTNGTRVVAFPLTSTLKSPNVASNVTRNGTTTVRRHQTQWTEDTTQPWSDGTDKVRCAKVHCGGMTS